MSYEDGLRLLEAFGDAEALWIDRNGELLMSPGMEKLIHEA